MNPYIYRLGILIIFPSLISSETSARVQISLSCSKQPTCGDCITHSPECAWCSEPDYDKNKPTPRCNVLEKFSGDSSCNGDYLVYPEQIQKTEEPKKLSEPGANVDDIVQITPQEVHLDLRPGEPFPLRLDFRQAEDYPVDLYYLMDLSKSMEDDKEKLALLGDLLAEKMSNITKNFHLGFGSFVDKVVMPYVSTVPEKLKEPCTKCAAPYGFKNHMSLDSKTDTFKEEVAKAQVSGNLDAPEGGFDAIMQAIVCEKEINWRAQSRKLLVFSTDSGFHYAGDGKLGGIVKPNDGLCHLNRDGLYTESTTQDYPSLSQINQKTIEKKVHVIFAVTANQVRIYEQLSQNLVGSTTGKLEDDSSNVVDLIKNQYDKISSSVELTAVNASDDVEVTFYSTCLSDVTQETSICTGLKVGSTVPFTAKIKLKRCPEDKKKWKQTFYISPVGIKEAVKVNINMMCACDCEDPAKEVKDSPKCSDGNGTYSCGICKCNPNREGKLCECDIDSPSMTSENQSCIRENEKVVCSGTGFCSCNKCICRNTTNAQYYGTYCECSDEDCDYRNNLLCNGKGTCKCGECQCEEGWIGDACECYNKTDGCVHPDDADKGTICSDNGYCSCGQCICRSEKGNFYGKYCRECQDCDPQRCDDYRACVQCKVFNSGVYTEEQCEKECVPPPVITEVDVAQVENKTEKICRFPDDDECKFTFVYGYAVNDSTPYVRVQRTKDCPPPLNILMIVLGVIGGIVAIGLCLLLIWKLLTTIHDRREFAKFEKERQMAKWDTGENPIFKQATSTFKNPTYGGK